jgi:hypothetical protein
MDYQVANIVIQNEELCIKNILAIVQLIAQYIPSLLPFDFCQQDLE